MKKYFIILLIILSAAFLFSAATYSQTKKSELSEKEKQHLEQSLQKRFKKKKGQ